MEPVLFQDSLWFVAAVFWLLAGLLARWPRRQQSRERRAEFAWIALCGLQAAAAFVHLLNFDAGAPAKLIRADWIAGGLQLAAFALAAWPGGLGAWIEAVPRRTAFRTALAVQALLWPAAALALGWMAPLLKTDFLPWGLGRSGLAFSLGLAALAVAWQAHPAPRHRRDLAPLWLALVLLIGVGLAEWLAAQSRARSAEAVVIRAQSLALALDEDAVRALAINERTHQSAPFRTLRAQLLRLRRANPDAAYLYLMTLHDGRVIYPVSGAEFYYSDKNGSLERIAEQNEPYELGPPATPFYRQLFTAKPGKNWEFSREPSFYGTLLSAYAPILESTDAAPRLVLGLDVRSPTFLTGARHARRLAQALALAGVAAVLLFLRYQIDSEAAEADRLARQASDQRERTRNEFLGMISHELRTPVHAILARTGALRQGSPVEETAAELDTLAGDLQRLVEDLLQASALQGPSFRLQPRRCRLPAVLREIARVAERDAAVKGLAFTTAFSPRLPATVRVDELRLRQVLVNLLSNAVKYTSAGEIRFTATVSDDAPITSEVCTVRFTVSDTGPGLTASAQARAFEPFFRAGETAWQPGMGLGLAVARALSERLGGQLSFQPNTPRGASFQVLIPLPIEATATAATSASRSHGRTALIVEDHPSLRLHLAEQIEHLGWTALAADSIAAADARWTETPPTVVFVDQQLPDGTGAAWLAQRLPSEGPRPWVIGMSASLDPKIAEALLAAGADDFLYKPVSLDALRDALDLRSPLVSATPFTPKEISPPITLTPLQNAIDDSDWPAAARETHQMLNHLIASDHANRTEALQATRLLEAAIARQNLERSRTALRSLITCLS